MRTNSVCLLVRSYVSNLGQLIEFSHKFGGPLVELLDVNIFQRELILCPADTIIDGNILDRLQIQRYTRNLISQTFL